MFRRLFKMHTIVCRPIVVKARTIAPCGATFRLAIGLRFASFVGRTDLAGGASGGADLHRNYVGSVERGERDIGITALNRLAQALGVSPDEACEPGGQSQPEGRPARRNRPGLDHDRSTHDSVHLEEDVGT